MSFLRILPNMEEGCLKGNIVLKVISSRFMGFATCWTRPWWKFWIRIYEVRLNNGDTEVLCMDCKNICTNYKIWFIWNMSSKLNKIPNL